jgi:hypothetical protein
MTCAPAWTTKRDTGVLVRPADGQTIPNHNTMPSYRMKFCSQVIARPPGHRAMLLLRRAALSAPVPEAAGIVSRIEAGPGHPVVVVFDLRHLVTPLVGPFMSDEPVVIVGESRQ